MWKTKLSFEVHNFSFRHVNGWIIKERQRVRWLLTGFYDHPKVIKRKMSWYLLSRLNPENILWCIIENFNKILVHTKKRGGRDKLENQRDSFRIALEENQLHDLEYKGDIFMWSNKHADESFINERLDRAVFNLSWKELYTNLRVVSMVARCSYNKLIILSMSNKEIRQHRRRQMFRFEDRCKR